MPASPLIQLFDMSRLNTIETALSACRIDVDNQAQLSAACEHASIARSTMQAMLDVFRPLSQSLEIYVTR